MTAEDLIKDMAIILFEPEIEIALKFYNVRQNQGRENTVASDLLRKRAVLAKAYAQYKGQHAGRVSERDSGNG
jgi:hypothetical protein